MCRIVRVDLRFPPKPIISASARDLICQVTGGSVVSLHYVSVHCIFSLVVDRCFFCQRHVHVAVDSTGFTDIVLHCG
jgi:hypothetical protein